MKYGVFIGRFQPFHLGHMAIVNEILHDGLVPIILIGSANESGTNKNPLSYVERVALLRDIYDRESVNIDRINDYLSDDEWLRKVHNKITDITFKEREHIKSCTLYYYPKPHDIKGGKHPMQLFESIMPIKIATYPDKLGIKVNATDIRNDLEGNKHFLPHESYVTMKEYYKREPAL